MVCCNVRHSVVNCKWWELSKPKLILNHSKLVETYRTKDVFLFFQKSFWNMCHLLVNSKPQYVVHLYIYCIFYVAFVSWSDLTFLLWPRFSVFFTVSQTFFVNFALFGSFSMKRLYIYEKSGIFFLNSQTNFNNRDTIRDFYFITIFQSGALPEPLTINEIYILSCCHDISRFDKIID